ncbi:hypothetical protein [Desulforamulus reducens]|uniref:hypothetical protein n=1 Tax=Desulforamulus reducens TaxID=59610 RepID=UPI0018DC3AD4|nr:hypothetical protein [Desulforamulus reducens]
MKALREVFDLPFLLPENRFYKKEEYTSNIERLPRNDYRLVKDDISECMYSIALTNRDFISYSERIE